VGIGVWDECRRGEETRPAPSPTGSQARPWAGPSRQAADTLGHPAARAAGPEVPAGARRSVPRARPAPSCARPRARTRGAASSSSRSGRGTAATAHQRDIPHEMKTEVGRLPEGGGGRRWLAARSRRYRPLRIAHGPEDSIDGRLAISWKRSGGLAAAEQRAAKGSGRRTRRCVRGGAVHARGLRIVRGSAMGGREAQFSLRWARRCLLPSRCRWA
jgi:hypothetical protein